MKKNSKAIGLVGFSLIVVIGLCILTAYSTYNVVGNFNFNDFDFSTQFTESSAQEENLNFNNVGGKKLIVKSDAGDISILPSTGNQLAVDMVKTGWGIDETSAQEAMDGIEVTVKETSNTIELTYAWPATYDKFGSQENKNTVDFVIQLPADVSIEIDLNIGAVELTDLEATAQVDVDFGEININGFTGPLTVKNNLSDITLIDIDAGVNTVSVEGDFGDVTIENLMAGNFNLAMQNSDVKLTNIDVAQAVSIDNDFGKIEIKDFVATSLMIDSSNGTTSLENITLSDTLTLNQDFGEITIQALSTSETDITSSNSAIAITDNLGKLTIKNEFGGIKILESYNAILDIEMQNGEFSFTGSLDESANHRIRNDFGTVKLEIPADSNFNVDLETQFGEINSEIPITVSETLSNSHWVGSINAGGKLLRISTNNGEIQITITE